MYNQHAWRTYAAARISAGDFGTTEYVAQLADAMLAEEKKRFADRQPIDPLAGTSNDYQTGVIRND
ncbi:hypothetical protein UFOVP353_31 [uncultured Caudovirales phage]|uniref:Uncharacterized protein n=1 Tax=uncultured Caudovirales phage TaxID=2100421 RepID=A0A6J5M442_9CAUD|nr:hypothetical protein UFOVP353_31 [uncultured Caudovirales phage]